MLTKKCTCCVLFQGSHTGPSSERQVQSMDYTVHSNHMAETKKNCMPSIYLWKKVRSPTYMPLQAKDYIDGLGFV